MSARPESSRSNRRQRTTTIGGRLAGKVVAITGAGAGIGLACARRYCAEGAAVVLNDYDAPLAEDVCHSLRRDGHEAVAMGGDVARRQTLDAMVERALEDFGQLDVFHNNAGIGIMGAVADVSDEDWQRQLEIIVNGSFYGTRAALEAMLPAGSGVILNTASGAGLAGSPGQAAYTTAKHAVIGLTKSTAIDYAARGIRANAICPGPVYTEAWGAVESGIPGGLENYEAQLPRRRIGQAAEVAAVAAFLSSDDASYVSGAIIPVDAGVSALLALPALFGISTSD
jgi:meso-butanediol dehydrogenase/(S,S)-butanediol dehydrogenase/diacetyl reductase